MVRVDAETVRVSSKLRGGCFELQLFKGKNFFNFFFNEKFYDINMSPEVHDYEVQKVAPAISLQAHKI